MSEYLNVEHPFLEKLREIGWQVIDKGSGGIPQDPTETMRDSFDEIVLKKEFDRMLFELNPWISEAQKSYCYSKITGNDKPLIDANHETKKVNGITVERGSTLTSIAALSLGAKTSINSVKHSLKKLADSGEITEEIKPKKFRIITIKNYNNPWIDSSS